MTHTDLPHIRITTKSQFIDNSKNLFNYAYDNSNVMFFLLETMSIRMKKKEFMIYFNFSKTKFYIFVMIGKV